MKHHTEEFDELVVVFQDPSSRRWFPVGRLSCERGFYQFRYTRGSVEAKESGTFLPFGVMTDLEATYRSEKLFPLFQNRVMPRSRPEYKTYTHWLLGDSDESGELSPLRELGRSGGARATDNIQLYPVPKNVDGYYRMSFFAHGVRHLPDASRQAIDAQRLRTALLLRPDPNNEHDSDALTLWTEDPSMLVGYCPRFLCLDFLTILDRDRQTQVVLAQINPDAPMQFRYRCELTARWPDGFKPFDTAAFQFVSGEVVAT
jgi:hypothetical protein